MCNFLCLHPAACLMSTKEVPSSGWRIPGLLAMLQVPVEQRHVQRQRMQGTRDAAAVASALQSRS